MFDYFLFGICGSALVISLVVAISTYREVTKLSYRRLYIQCVARLDVVAVILNQMKALAEHVDDREAMDQYENSLEMMESLLSALVQVPVSPSGKDLVTRLQPMLFKLEEETDKAVKAFKQALKSKTSVLNIFKKNMNDAKPPVQGCYFCSSPYSPKTFKRVRIQLAKRKLKVYGCDECRETLNLRGAVDVLFFRKDGHNVHWADTPNYKPKTDFWLIHKMSPKFERPKLEVLSQEDPPE